MIVIERQIDRIKTLKRLLMIMSLFLQQLCQGLILGKNRK
jgi:hypothetical protein